jgi:hypothetical protein
VDIMQTVAARNRHPHLGCRCSGRQLAPTNRHRWHTVTGRQRAQQRRSCFRRHSRRSKRRLHTVSVGPAKTPECR